MEENKQPIEAITFLSNKEIEKEIKEMDKEKKTYLVLMVIYEDDQCIHDFEFLKGRTTTYGLLKDLIRNGDIDIHESKVLTSKVDLDNMLTVYEFMKLMQDRNYYPEDSFDIDEYDK